MLLDDRDAAQQISEHSHAEDPSDSAEDIEGNEPAVVHLSDARHEWREGPDDGDESRVDDRLAAVLFVEGMRAGQMLAAEPAGIRTVEDGGTRASTQRVAERIAEDGRGHEDEIHDEHVQIPGPGHRAD